MSELEEAAAAAQAALDDQLQATYGGKINEWVELLKGEHGCWCGPGNRCEEEVDAVDSCCHRHDLAYDALGLTFDTMWTADAFVKTRAADEELVSCLSSAEAPDEETKIYREGIIAVFAARLDVSKWLESLGV